MRIVSRREVPVLLSLLPAAALTACSTHPLPEDVTRKSTYDIVQALRCEIKAGLRDVQPEANILKSTIGMDFSFDITENNSTGGGSLTFTKLFGGESSFTLNSTAMADRSRQNKREFRILESLTEVQKTSCDRREREANLTYPITGRIGLDEVVRTYIRVEKSTSLDLRKDSDVVFSDELTFTTEMKAGVTPTVKLDAAVGSFKVTNATFAASTSRKDIHKVVIALAHDPKLDVDRKLLSQRLELKTLIGPLGRSSRAYDGVVSSQLGSRSRVIYELDRKKALSEDARLLELLRPRIQ